MTKQGAAPDPSNQKQGPRLEPSGGSAPARLEPFSRGITSSWEPRRRPHSANGQLVLGCAGEKAPQQVPPVVAVHTPAQLSEVQHAVLADPVQSQPGQQGPGAATEQQCAATAVPASGGSGGSMLGGQPPSLPLSQEGSGERDCPGDSEARWSAGQLANPPGRYGGGVSSSSSSAGNRWAGQGRDQVGMSGMYRLGSGWPAGTGTGQAPWLLQLSTHPLATPILPCLPCCSNPNSMLSDPLLEIVRQAMRSQPPPCEGDAAASGGAAGTPPQAKQEQQGSNGCERSSASESSAAADRMAGCLTVALRCAGRCSVGWIWVGSWLRQPYPGGTTPKQRQGCQPMGRVPMVPQAAYALPVPLP